MYNAGEDSTLNLVIRRQGSEEKINEEVRELKGREREEEIIYVLNAGGLSEIAGCSLQCFNFLMVLLVLRSHKKYLTPEGEGF